MGDLLCRSAKHIFKNYIQEVEASNVSAAVSHFLNCLLSNVSQSSLLVQDEPGKNLKRKSKKFKSHKNGTKSEKQSSDWVSLTSKTLWALLRNEMDSYYNWTCSKNVDSIDSLLAKYSIQKLSLLRIFCIRAGIQILLREYNFDQKARPFNEDDIMNIFPVVKHISPRSEEPYSSFVIGRRKLETGNFKEAYEYLMDALNTYNNVYGPLHSDIIECLRWLARINYILQDYGEAVTFQLKAVLMSEKVNGVDHPTTITEYVSSLFISFTYSTYLWICLDLSCFV